MPSGPEDIEHGPICSFPRLSQRNHIFRELASTQEHRGSIAAAVRVNDFPDLNRVVSEEIMQHQLPNITEHAVAIVPRTEEPQNVAVVVHELLQGVVFLVGSEGLHTFIHLKRKNQ